MEDFESVLSLSFDALELFWSFITPYLSKLIKAFKFYNWKGSEILTVFFLIFWMFFNSSISNNAPAQLQKSPLFDVLFYMWTSITNKLRSHVIFTYLESSFHMFKNDT